MLRRAVIEEREEIFRLYRASVGEEFCFWDEEYPGMENILEDIEAGGLFVWDDGGIAGAVSVVPENELDWFDGWTETRGAEIARVVIEKSHRGAGLAGKMVGELLRSLRDCGVRSVHLSVADGNLPAMAVYRKLGFSAAGAADMYGGHYFLMEKQL